MAMLNNQMVNGGLSQFIQGIPIDQPGWAIVGGSVVPSFRQFLWFGGGVGWANNVHSTTFWT